MFWYTWEIVCTEENETHFPLNDLGMVSNHIWMVNYQDDRNSYNKGQNKFYLQKPHFQHFMTSVDIWRSILGIVSSLETFMKWIVIWKKKSSSFPFRSGVEKIFSLIFFKQFLSRVKKTQNKCFFQNQIQRLVSVFSSFKIWIDLFEQEHRTPSILWRIRSPSSNIPSIGMVNLFVIFQCSSVQKKYPLK